MEFGDLFSFDKKIGPALIKPLYWIGLVLIALSGVIFFFSGFFSMFWHPGAGIWTMVTTIIMVPISVLALRIAAEACIAIFEAHDRQSGSPPSTMS